MTRKDFQFIADVLRTTRLTGVTDGDTTKKVIDRMIDLFSDELARTSERFDRDKFIRACNRFALR